MSKVTLLLYYIIGVAIQMNDGTLGDHRSHDYSRTNGNDSTTE